MKDMNNNYTRKIQLLTETECRQAIEEAKKGQLSPYWQMYHLNNLARHKGTALYPENGNTLTEQLQSAIMQVEQISDAQQTAKEHAAINSELLFFYTEEPDTVLEISYSIPLHAFCCNVELDSSLTQKERAVRIEQMRSAVERWIRASGKQWTFPVNATESAEVELDHFDTMEETLAYLFHWMDMQTTIQSGI